jgi:hypothetical protein
MFAGIVSPMQLGVSVLLCHMAVYRYDICGLVLLVTLSIQTIGAGVLFFLRPSCASFCMLVTMLCITQCGALWLGMLRHRSVVLL